MLFRSAHANGIHIGLISAHAAQLDGFVPSYPVVGFKKSIEVAVCYSMRHKRGCELKLVSLALILSITGGCANRKPPQPDRYEALCNSCKLKVPPSSCRATSENPLLAGGTSPKGNR